jgi:hypothetical protein
LNLLDELKQRTEKHMKNELDILKIIFAVDNKDTREYTSWYNSHPYCKCIDEIREIVNRRAEADARSKTSSDLRPRSTCETGSR